MESRHVVRAALAAVIVATASIAQPGLEGAGAVGSQAPAAQAAASAIRRRNVLRGIGRQDESMVDPLRRAVAAIDLPAVRARQKRGEPDGRLIGLGISIFSEQTAHGTTADGKRRVFYEQAFARLTPDGRLEGFDPDA